MELNNALMNVLAAKQRESGSAPVMSRVSSFQRGGKVDPAPAMIMEAATPTDDLEQAINALMAERDATDDPLEQQILESTTENIATQSAAPMAEQAMMLAEQGRGGDTRLAHLRVGEVVMPPEAFDDAQFEATVGAKFEELDLDPEAYIVGAGIASLNPITGLEEFGFFKKAFKSLKKVVKKVAPVAMLVPGVGTALGAALGGIGGLAGGALSAIPGLGGVVGTVGSGLSTALKGIGSLGIPGVSSIAGGASAGSFTAPFASLSGLSKADQLKALLGGGPLGTAGSTYYGGPAAGKGLANMLGLGSGATPAQQVAALKANPQTAPSVQAAINAGATTDEQILAALGVQTGVGSGLVNTLSSLGGPSVGSGSLGGLGSLGTLGAIGAAGALGKLAYDEAKTRKGVPLTPLTQEGATGRYNIEAEIARRMGQPAPNPVEFGLLPTGTIPTLAGGRATPQPAQPIEPVEDSAVMTARDGGSVMAQADKSLQKLQQQSGAAITPQEMAQEVLKIVRANSGSAVTEQEVESVILTLLRRRSGAAITAKEFEQVRDAVQDLLGRKYGGPVMAFKDGGNVDMAEFKRMDGKIAGPGTEISDDIPAMLSDGEFVMTGRAVRGAGAFDMSKGDGGIITLSPSKEEDRDRGTKLMYDMMDLFSEFAGART